MITINSFRAEDVPAASQIAGKIWEREIPGLTPDLSPYLYEFLVRYYFVEASEYNVAARDESGKLVGFLLGAREHIVGQAPDDWLRTCPKEVREHPMFKDYREYLEFNREAETRYAKPDDLLLLLFCSTRRGAGRLMMEEMDLRCASNPEIRSTLLWTDETCDFDYYRKRGYHEAASYVCETAPGGQKFATWLFRRVLKQTAG